MLSGKKLTSLVLAGLMSATIGLGVLAADPATPPTPESNKKLIDENKKLLDKVDDRSQIIWRLKD